MKLKVFYTVDELEHNFLITCEDKESCNALLEQALTSRKLDVKENGVWSIEVKD